MKMLFIGQEPWHEAIVTELRKDHDVDYVFKSDRFTISKGNYQLPKLFHVHLCYTVLTYLITNLLLLVKRYDICLTDYKSVFVPTIFPILKKYTNIINTSFVYDMRTVPVEYAESRANVVENLFARKVRFANRFYQGISVITEEMRKYVHNRYVHFNKPVGIWESGVDLGMFRPLPKNLRLKRALGFNDNDFICFYHGALSDRRGVIELVESFRILQPLQIGIKLFLLGRGMSQERLQELIKNLRLEDTVKIHDWVDYESVSDYISIADLCIVPLPDIDWWRVSSPLKLMEYIACGKNILLTNIVAHTHVVGSSSGYFWVHDATAEAFASGITEAYHSFTADSVRYYERGMTEREKLVDRISWEARAQSLLGYLVQLKEAAALQVSS
jgi:glycosyltransferase involved in cell wall biosynthesis